MFPILVKLGPLTIHTYGLLMAVGRRPRPLVRLRPGEEARAGRPEAHGRGFLHHHRLARRGQAHPVRRRVSPTTSSYPKELFSLARSGGVFQGGLTFGVIFALWYFRRKKIPTWKAADIIAPALALGHGFGRIGCFAAGCCYGSDCELPWGATFNNEYAHELTGHPARRRPSTPSSSTRRSSTSSISWSSSWS